MEEKIHSNETMFQLWSSQDMKIAQIKNDLINQNYSHSEIESLLSGYDKYINQKRTDSGFKCMAGGGFFCGTSALLTFFNVFPDMRIVSLYGMTFLGICVGVYGLYLLLEKRQLT